jgi:ankyrin repeat protein
MTKLDFQFLDSVATASEEALRKMLEAGADVNVRDILSGYRPLHLAVGRGELDIIRLFISYGADINASDNDVNRSALCSAALRPDMPVVKLLLEAGARLSPEEVHGGLLSSSSSELDPAIRRILLKHIPRE